MSNQQQEENTELFQEVNEIVKKSMDGLVKKLTKVFTKREKMLVKQIQQLNKVSTRHMHVNSSGKKPIRGKLSGKRKKKYSREYESSSSSSEYTE